MNFRIKTEQDHFIFFEMRKLVKEIRKNDLNVIKAFEGCLRDSGLNVVSSEYKILEFRFENKRQDSLSIIITLSKSKKKTPGYRSNKKWS